MVISSATIVEEASWLEEMASTSSSRRARGGGHRGMFLTDHIAQLPGTFALVPQVVEAVKVPVVAQEVLPKGVASQRR